MQMKPVRQEDSTNLWMIVMAETAFLNSMVAGPWHGLLEIMIQVGYMSSQIHAVSDGALSVPRAKPPI